MSNRHCLLYTKETGLYQMHCASHYPTSPSQASECRQVGVVAACYKDIKKEPICRGIVRNLAPAAEISAELASDALQQGKKNDNGGTFGYYENMKKSRTIRTTTIQGRRSKELSQQSKPDLDHYLFWCLVYHTHTRIQPADKPRGRKWFSVLASPLRIIDKMLGKFKQ